MDTCLFTLLNTVIFFIFSFAFGHSQALNPFVHLNTVIDFYLCTVACTDSQYLWDDEHNGRLSLYAVEYSDLFVTFFCVCVCVFKHSKALNPFMHLNSVIDFCNVSQYIWRDEHNGHISLHSWILSLTFTSIQLHAMTAGIFEEMNTVDTYLFTQLNTVTFSLLYVFKHSQALNLLMQLSSVIDFYWLHAMTAGIFEEMNTVWTLIYLHSWIQGPFYFFMCLNIARLWILSCSWILSLTFMSIQLHAMTAGIFEEMNTVWTLIYLHSWIQGPFYFFMCLNIARLWILSCSWILSLTFMSIQLHAMTAGMFEEMNTMDTSLYAVEYGALFISLRVMNTVNPYLFTLLNTMTLLCLTSLV